MDSSISAAPDTEMVHPKGVKRPASPTNAPTAPSTVPTAAPTAQPILAYKSIPAYAPGTDLSQLPLYGAILRQLNEQYLRDLAAAQTLAQVAQGQQHPQQPQQVVVVFQKNAPKVGQQQPQPPPAVEAAEPPPKKKKRTPNPNRYYDPEYPVRPEIRVHTRRIEPKETLAALEVLRKRRASLSSADNRNRYAIIAATGRVVSASHLRKKVEEMGIIWEY